jgi:SagB-type dehydrogenase family enzyme
MRSAVLLFALPASLGCAGGTDGAGPSAAGLPSPAPPIVSLPSPRLEGPLSLEETLAARRSVRTFADAPVTIEQAAQLLWAAQGVTDERRGFRTAPSAGALYPLEVYLVADRVTSLRRGIYRYLPDEHALVWVGAAGSREELARAALSQSVVSAAPAILAFSAVFDRTTQKYGERGKRYVYLEAGHAAQNVYLQAGALGLGTAAIGAFSDDAVRRAIGMDPVEQPLYLMPFGSLPAQ